MSDYLNAEKDFPELLTLFEKLILALEGEKATKEHLIYAHGLGIKIFRMLTEVHILYSGTLVTFEDRKHFYIDVNSILVLIRVILEGFAVFYYIFWDSKNEEETKFRFNVWKLKGYMERQGFHSEMKESKLKLETEKNEIEVMKEWIATNNFFKLHEKPDQNRILSGDWKIGQKIPELMEKSGFNKEYVGKIYSYLCGFSHNSWASVMQSYQMKTTELQKKILFPSIQFALMLLANVIYWYQQMSEKTKLTFEEDKYRYDCAIAWRNFGLHMMSCEHEVMLFIINNNPDLRKNLSKEKSFSELGFSDIQKIKLIKDFASKKFYQIEDFNLPEIKTVGDLINQYIHVREKVE